MHSGTYGEPFVSKWRYKIPCIGVPNWNDKSTRCVLSISSGKDRLNVFYQLDLSTASGKEEYQL